MKIRSLERRLAKLKTKLEGTKHKPKSFEIWVDTGDGYISPDGVTLTKDAYEALSPSSIRIALTPDELEI